MATKKPPLDKSTMFVVALIAIVIGFFIYNFIMGLKAPITTVRNVVADFKEINQDALGLVKSLNVCGNWPYLTVILNNDRGNPFSRKGDPAQQMVATDVVQCQQITQ